MNKLIKACVIAAGFALMAGPASADGNFYAGISAVGYQVGDYGFNNGRGGTSRDAEFDPSFGGAARIGYDFGTFRTDIEVGYTEVDVEGVSGSNASSGSFDLYTVMLNGYVDFEIPDTSVTPYISLGAGVAGADGDISFLTGNGAQESVTFDETAPAGQIGVGVAIGLSDSIDLVAGYNLLGAYSDEGNDDDRLLVHTGRIGLNFSF